MAQILDERGEEEATAAPFEEQEQQDIKTWRCFDVHDSGWSLVRKRGTKKALPKNPFGFENQVPPPFKNKFSVLGESQQNAGREPLQATEASQASQAAEVSHGSLPVAALQVAEVLQAPQAFPTSP